MSSAMGGQQYQENVQPFRALVAGGNSAGDLKLTIRDGEGNEIIGTAWLRLEADGFRLDFSGFVYRGEPLPDFSLRLPATLGDFSQQTQRALSPQWARNLDGT